MNPANVHKFVLNVGSTSYPGHTGSLSEPNIKPTPIAVKEADRSKMVARRAGFGRVVPIASRRPTGTTRPLSVTDLIQKAAGQNGSPRTSQRLLSDRNEDATARAVSSRAESRLAELLLFGTLPTTFPSNLSLAVMGWRERFTIMGSICERRLEDHWLPVLRLLFLTGARPVVNCTWNLNLPPSTPAASAGAWLACTFC
jgi:hypothetical protein